MTPQELRASILQQAIQGKLVEQCPEEGTGEELFQQIQAEKQELIKASKIKRDKGNKNIAIEDTNRRMPSKRMPLSVITISVGSILNPK